jgi:hypothetical protein
MKRKTIIPVVLLVIWCVAGVLLRCAPTATVLNSPNSVDSLIPLSGAWALHSGLRIHTDFSSPLGVACYLPYYWTMETFGNNAKVIREADAGIYVAVSILAFLLLKPPRFSWRVAALGVALTSLVAASPCSFFDPPTIIYEGDQYNCLCVALGFLCLLTATSNTSPGAKEAALLGFCLTWVAFVKFNFVVVDLAFIMAASVYSRFVFATRWLRFYLLLAGFIALFTTAFVICFHVDLIGMFRDLHMAAAARFNYVTLAAPNTDYGGIIHYGLDSIVTHICLVLGHQAIALCLLALIAWLQRSPAAGALVAFVLALDIGQNLFNSYGLTLPMIPCLFLFLLGASGQSSAPILRRWLPLPVLFYIAWFATGYLVAVTANLNPSKQCPTFRAAGFERIYFENVSDERTTNYAVRINSGLDLLRSNKLDDRRVFVTDFINPFPFLLAAPYPQGQPVWMHAEGTYNSEHHLPPKIIFAGADVILLPQESSTPWNVTSLILIYGKWIHAHYKLVAKNDHWEAYTKITEP